MKRAFKLLGIVLAVSAIHAGAAVPIASPQVLVCPGPMYPAKCATPVWATLNSSNSAASGSKSAPVWAHTFAGYTDKTTLIVACPVGAIVSDDARTCTSAAGADLSALMTKASILAIPPFSATVTLKWTPPTQNTDGSALTDLDHYTVYLGTDPAHWLSIGTISPGATAYTTPALLEGTYFFAVTSTNAAKQESANSATVSAIIAKPGPKVPNPPPGPPTATINLPPQ